MSSTRGTAHSVAVVNRLARAQHGVVSREQARECGISNKTQRRLLAEGVWRFHLGCLVINPHQPSTDAMSAAAIGLRLGSTAIVTGPIAVRLGGWSIPDTDLIAWIGNQHNMSVPEIRILRDARSRSAVAGATCLIATPAVALIDTLLHVSKARAGDLCDLALQRRWISKWQWTHLIDDRLGIGRTGSARLRRLTQRVMGGTRSDGERRLATLMRRANLTGWIANYPLRDGAGLIVAELDFANPALRLCIEVDGRAAHSGPEQFERDRQRQNLITLMGWTVLRFTWKQLTENPTWVLEQIRHAIALRSCAL